MASTTHRTWLEAGPEDAPILLALIRDFYQEGNLIFEASRMALALTELLADPSLGRVFLLRDGSSACGYFVSSFGFSLEFGGSFVLLDELYIAPAARGFGEGGRALGILESWARAQGVAAIRLEVNHGNQKAAAIYQKSGYRNENRDLFTKSLLTPARDGVDR